ncbi:MAG: DUF3592 domain-containing protein [Anaerolineales bacterium]|nr:DUF3592 domain-containing protein [Anaerolineales bacterium]MCZ2121410.1 DUF3592 domain-containing protein [Anaerolineales bacterium]
MANKKYSINWEDDFPSSYEVDGIRYENLEDVPDESDRRKLEAMSNSAFMADIHTEIEDQEQSAFTAEKIILWVFSGVAILMLGIALFSSFGVIKKISKEESTFGRVIDMIVKVQYTTIENSAEQIAEKYYYPVVEFNSIDGRYHSVQLIEGSNPAAFEIGDEVTVLYDPEHPLNARIKSFGSSMLMWVLPGITGILGVSFLIAVLAVQRFLFSK